MEKFNFHLLLSLLIFNQIINENTFKIPFKFYSTNIFFENQTHPLTSKYMSQIVIELPIGTPSQTFNLSLNLNSFHSLFLNHKLPGHIIAQEIKNIIIKKTLMKPKFLMI